MKKISSTIQVEKFEREPGIYIIFNKETDNVYIGKANDLKRRMEEHVRNLFLGCDNNRKLQKEFAEGGHNYRIGLLKVAPLDKTDEYESVFFQAAERLYSRECVYNSTNLYNANLSENQIQEACKIIEAAVKRKTQNKGVYLLKTESVQDWIEKSNKEIAQEATKKIQKLSEFYGDDKQQRDAKLESISLRKLYEEDKLDYIMIGVMGDYVGDGRAQTITDILSEKLADITYYEKCLWASAGPNIDDFKRFYKCGVEGGKKIFALFPLTTAKYKNEKKSVSYIWKDIEGRVYSCTAPEQGSHRYKGLVIKNIWTVEEDFPIYKLYDLYYRYEKPKYNKNNGERKLPNDVQKCARQMQCVVSKKAILNDEALQKKLELQGDLLEEFIREKAPDKEKASNFVKCSDGDHPIRYLLVEVLDYVWMEQKEI